jgi:hypothetical protein
MANNDPLANIRLFDGSYSKQPRLETGYNAHAHIVLSIRKMGSAIGRMLILETNPFETAETEDWVPVSWHDGIPVQFTEDGDAVLPACNNYIRLRMLGALPAAATITLK